jgi:hypothetical protein
MGRMFVAGIIVAAVLAVGPACNKEKPFRQPITKTMKADIMVEDTAKVAMIVPKKIETEKQKIEANKAKLDTLEMGQDIPPMEVKFRPKLKEMKIIHTPIYH